MVNHYSILNTDGPKQRRRKSQKQEKRLARDTGGKVQAGSGAVWSAKGDAKDKDHFLESARSFLHECKYTSHASFRLSYALWEEIRQKAFIEGRNPAIELKLNEGTDKELDLIVLSRDDYLMLRGDLDG